jgi:CheY-like chemotaxis protein
MKICIIDDNSTNCYVLKELLSFEKGISELKTYTNPENFIEDLYKMEKTPDLILTDIMMPGIDGYTLSNKIKLHFPEIRIIGITALPKSKCLLEDVEKCGMENVIFKPYDMKCLLEYIR